MAGKWVITIAQDEFLGMDGRHPDGSEHTISHARRAAAAPYTSASQYYIVKHLVNQSSTSHVYVPISNRTAD